MTNEKLYEVLGDINENYVKEARADYKAKKPGWAKWGSVAACFAVIAVLGISVFQRGLFGNKTDIATLKNGTEIVFVKSEMTASSIDIDGAVTTRQLTEGEIATLFPNLPVTAHAIFRTSDMDAGNSLELIGFEGNIGNIKIIFREFFQIHWLPSLPVSPQFIALFILHPF